MITSEQIRSARAALRWTIEHLANSSGISVRTIKNLENSGGVPDSRTSTLSAIQATLEAAGIEFIGSPDDAPGIRLRKKKD